MHRNKRMRDRPRVFYGWWIVAACSLGLFLSTGSIVVLSFGVFVKPLIQDFHASRASVSFALTLHSVTAAAGVALIGRMIDRLGASRVVLAGTAIFGLILVCSEMLGTGIAYLYLFYTALGLVAGSTSPVPYGTVVSRWFDRRRGTALSIMMAGFGLGAFTLPMLAHWLIVIFDWRMAYASFGCAALLFSLPVMVTLLKDDPEQKGLYPDGATLPTSAKGRNEALQGLSWPETWHQSSFWVLICAFFLASASLHACLVHLAALLTDRGVSAQGAAVATSLAGLALLLGRLCTGYLLDRFFAPRVAMVMLGGASAGIALLWAGAAGKCALLVAFLIGTGMGAEGDLIAYCIGRYFGLRAFGRAFGYCFGAYVLAGALGVFLMGAGFDLTHSYNIPLGVIFFCMLISVALMSQAGPYRYAAVQVSRVRDVVSVGMAGQS